MFSVHEKSMNFLFHVLKQNTLGLVLFQAQRFGVNGERKAWVLWVIMIEQLIECGQDMKQKRPMTKMAVKRIQSGVVGMPIQGGDTEVLQK